MWDDVTVPTVTHQKQIMIQSFFAQTKKKYAA